MQPLIPRSPQLGQRRRPLQWPAHWRILASLLVGTVAISYLQPAIAHPGHSALDSWLTQALTPHFQVAGLGIAFLLGMAHAVSPGHGKTMVAAYLVGTRGTPRDAVLLGLITTLTHTLGIFLLGLVVLFATDYILSAQLYPILSFLSGLLVFGVGFWLLDQRLQAMQWPPTPHAEHVHPHRTSHPHFHAHPHSPDQVHPHSHTHAHGHFHATPVTWRSLLTLGISGGIVPCPSALVLLLSAIALHQTAYGMALVSMFSLGLAVVLIGLGLLVIYARQWLDRLPPGPRLGLVQRYLPVASAIAVIIVGAGLTLGSVL